MDGIDKVNVESGEKAIKEVVLVDFQFNMDFHKPSAKKLVKIRRKTLNLEDSCRISMVDRDSQYGERASSCKRKLWDINVVMGGDVEMKRSFLVTNCGSDFRGAPEYTLAGVGGGDQPCEQQLKS